MNSGRLDAFASPNIPPLATVGVNIDSKEFTTGTDQSSYQSILVCMLDIIFIRVIVAH